MLSADYPKFVVSQVLHMYCLNNDRDNIFTEVQGPTFIRSASQLYISEAKSLPHNTYTDFAVDHSRIPQFSITNYCKLDNVNYTR